MALKDISIPQIHRSLTHSELIILRSIALGLGCDTVRDLLELSMPDYQKMCAGLFEKLQVCNAYAAVQKAYHNKILKNKEYTPEKVKGIALKYADLFQKKSSKKSFDTKKSVWEAIKRFRHGKPIFQLPLDGKEFITSLQINDTFLLDVDERTFDLNLESRSFIAKHLYRVQKLSSKFYEFRLVHDNEISSTESPSYIRINNFGHRKTGWQTHNPIKLSMNAIGTLIFRDEKKDFMQSLKSYL